MVLISRTIRGFLQHLLLAALFFLSLPFFSGTVNNAFGANSLFNGDFEAGSLAGWSAGSVNGGNASVVFSGTCFSARDTTGLTLSGNFAAILRSGASASTDSVGILTSDPFTAGTGLLFSALSETREKKTLDKEPLENPVYFEVRLLGTTGKVLFSETMTTAVVALSPDCFSDPRSGTFGLHFINTSNLEGQEIRLQFHQHTFKKGEGFFTLIDDVTILEGGELPILSGSPVAVAGTSFDANNKLQLDGSLSYDTDNGPSALTFSWSIDGESTPRVGETVLIDDLSAGDHKVTLTVSDGLNTSTDDLLFTAP